ncbi:uncharacterized protein B0H64DRAFT_386718 [Chaetomium fimeti]|uniref:Uncharacterized protein n=1 Tax=Chaetomium fimeti TaxID=1854472 RepID=A0AAE0HLW3_9PEZI|nr:hypothetical protein B0H64DRAFT_386718 [Chaetomium fimeti]
MPDLPTLRSLVRASPTMHAQYRSNRNALLRACLARELDGCFVDAYACLKSRAREMRPVRTNEKITDFLAGYRAWLSGPGPPSDMNSLDPSSCRWLAAFHVSVIRPLGRRFAAWALANMARARVTPAGGREAGEAEAEAEAVPDPQPTLSRSEEIRVFRTLYRYEIFCHLFGRNKCGRDDSFTDDEINEMFLCLFDPWEAEAIGCIDLFMRDKYKDIFEEVKWDLSDENPRYRQPDSDVNPLHSFDIDGQWGDFMDGTVSRGIEMLARILAVEGHQALVDKMERCLTHHHELDAPLRKALWSANQLVRRDEATSVNARDEAERRRDPMEFGGDAVPPDGPPLAWVLLWGGIYANIYGGHTPTSLRNWGYVIWDERRWTELGVKDFVVRQWETEPGLANEIEEFYGWRPVGC